MEGCAEALQEVHGTAGGLNSSEGLDKGIAMDPAGGIGEAPGEAISAARHQFQSKQLDHRLQRPAYALAKSFPKVKDTPSEGNPHSCCHPENSDSGHQNIDEKGSSQSVSTAPM
eukprot:jgi/Botrbrau1/5117/Bobra.0128s0025.1